MKTIICDIDGTIFEYVGGTIEITTQKAQLLPGVMDQFNRWELEGCRIILISGRRESLREKTTKDLERVGIPYDLLLMGYADAGRIIINDDGWRGVPSTTGVGGSGGRSPFRNLEGGWGVPPPPQKLYRNKQPLAGVCGS